MVKAVTCYLCGGESNRQCRCHREGFSCDMVCNEPEGDSPEIVSCLIEIEQAETTLALTEISNAWRVTPEQAAQVIADSRAPGQTFGEAIYLYLVLE